MPVQAVTGVSERHVISVPSVRELNGLAPLPLTVIPSLVPSVIRGLSGVPVHPVFAPSALWGSPKQRVHVVDGDPSADYGERIPALRIDCAKGVDPEAVVVYHSVSRVIASDLKERVDGLSPVHFVIEALSACVQPDYDDARACPRAVYLIIQCPDHRGRRAVEVCVYGRMP